MLTVHLNQVIFHAFHGLYEGEVKTGNNFEVSLSVSYEEKKLKFDNIENLISYESLFEIVRKRMKAPTPLLEEIADGILRKIMHEYPNVKEISISIFKLSAPINGFEGKVGITLQKKFDR